MASLFVVSINWKFTWRPTILCKTWIWKNLFSKWSWQILSETPFQKGIVKHLRNKQTESILFDEVSSSSSKNAYFSPKFFENLTGLAGAKITLKNTN